MDDNLISGPCKREVDINIKAILERFPGRIVEPGVKGEFLVWDLLGASWYYCRGKGIVKLEMAEYIEKIAQKFGVSKNSPNPNLGEFNLKAQENEVDFNIREICGSLQWAVSTARPDVARPVNALSRFCAEKCTQARLDAGRKIIGYLLKTRNAGLAYSPGSEEFFYSNIRWMGTGAFTPLQYTTFSRTLALRRQKTITIASRGPCCCSEALLYFGGQRNRVYVASRLARLSLSQPLMGWAI